MPFINFDEIPVNNVAPGVKLRTPYGEKIMLSHVEMEVGSEIPPHSHPHEQAGMILSGKLKLTIADEVKTCEAGDMYMIPSDVMHQAIALEGPVKVLDIFSPIREDYANFENAKFEE